MLQMETFHGDSLRLEMVEDVLDLVSFDVSSPLDALAEWRAARDGVWCRRLLPFLLQSNNLIVIFTLSYAWRRVVLDFLAVAGSGAGFFARGQIRAFLWDPLWVVLRRGYHRGCDLDMCYVLALCEGGRWGHSPREGPVACCECLIGRGLEILCGWQSRNAGAGM